MEEQKQFLQPDKPNYGEYKEWLNKTNSTGNQITPDAVSDGRVKKFIINSLDDDVLRKSLMLGLATNGIIDRSLADIYIMKKLVRGI